jgi:hypothetical protein
MAVNIQYPLDLKDMKYFITFRCRDYKYKNKTSLNAVEIEKINLCNVSLYFPGSFKESISQEWNAEEVLSVGSVTGKAINFLRDKGGKALFNRLNPGIAINPSEELMYQGPGFRTFEFEFDLISRSKEELQTVKKIEALFKILSLSRLDKTSMYIAFPAIWEIEIKGLEDEENGELFSLGYKNKFFALTTYSISYTPDQGYYPLKGGHPIKTSITLAFKETSPLYRKEISGESDIKGILNSVENFTT